MSARARMGGMDDTEIHVCTRTNGARTLCGLPAARNAAVDFSSYPTAHGPFCATCETAARWALIADEYRALLGEMPADRRGDYFIGRMARIDEKSRRLDRAKET